MKKSNLNPTWADWSHEFLIHCPTQIISFQVYDKDRLSADDFLGKLELNVLKLIDNSDKPMRLDTTKTHHPSSPTSFIHFVAEYFELSPVIPSFRLRSSAWRQLKFNFARIR